MSHRSKRPFPKMDLAAINSPAASTTSNEVAAAKVDTAASLLAALSRPPSTRSVQNLSQADLASTDNSQCSSRESLSASDLLDTDDPQRRGRRPRPRPINLGQINSLKTNESEPSASHLSTSTTLSGSSTASSSAVTVLQQSGLPFPPPPASQRPPIPPRHASPPVPPANGSSAKQSLDLNEEDLETLEELGMGAGGTVYRVRHRPSGTIMAKKIIHQLDVKASKEILRELQVLNRCQSQSIISFFGAYDHQGELCICMEYMDIGSLEKISKMSGKLPEKILAKVTLAVVEGLVYLYDNFRIIHRDIKPSNILVASNGKIKICDFGVSGVLENSIANTFVGTGAYMSPERIQGAKYSTQCDTWSLGLTLLELALGYYPFNPPPPSASEEDASDEPYNPPPLSVFELLQHIIQDPIPSLPRATDATTRSSDQYTTEFSDFIDETLQKDPKKRPTPKQLLQRPFLLAATDLRVDMAVWARRFLEPNLDPSQMQRWSITQKQKRESWMHMMGKRKSVRGSVDALRDGMTTMQVSDGHSRRTAPRP